MKQPKTLLLLSVIAAVLVLGVVYAAVTTNLTVTATATTAPEGSNFKVAFTGDKTVSAELTDTTTDTDTLVTANAEGQTATVTISSGVLKSKGDKVTATFTIKNSSTDLIANIAPSITNSNNDYYAATYDLEKASLNPDGTTTVSISIELVKNPLTEVNTTATLTLVATAAEA